MKMPLFVCHANCCRSVLAYYLYRHLCGAAALSAAMEVGDCINDRALAMLNRWGIDAREHCPRQLFSLPGAGATFSPDGAWIAAWGGGGVARVYDVRRGQEVLTIQRPKVSAIVFSADGGRLAVVGADSKVRILDTRTGQEVFTLKERARPGAKPVFSPDGLRIAVRDGDGVTRVYDARTGKESLALKESATSLDPTFSPDGTRIALAKVDGVVRVHDTGTGQAVVALKGPVPLNLPEFSPDGARIAAALSGPFRKYV